MKKKRKKKIYQEPTTIMMTLNMMIALIWVTESETPRNNGEKITAKFFDNKRKML